MKTYEFMILIREPFDESVVERVYAVCDDATVSSNEVGSTEVAFDRNAETIDDAMRSAIADLTKLNFTVEQIVMDSNAVGTLTASSI